MTNYQLALAENRSQPYGKLDPIVHLHLTIDKPISRRIFLA
jgi:hypothetical protein